jgi:hypothetical protein
MAGLRKVGLARGRFERIDDKGQSQPSLLPDDQERFSLRKPERWAAERDGYSVHAGVAFSALDRRGREGLLRYMLRPAIAVERVSILRDGSIAYRTKYKLRSGASARVMSPLEFLCRMAALVPPPRIPQLRYHGCLAAASPLRKLIAPAGSSQDCGYRSETKAEPACRIPATPELPENKTPEPVATQPARSARSSPHSLVHLAGADLRRGCARVPALQDREASAARRYHQGRDRLAHHVALALAGLWRASG